jgi:hypothetical protein
MKSQFQVWAVNGGGMTTIIGWGLTLLGAVLTAAILGAV